MYSDILSSNNFFCLENSNSCKTEFINLLFNLKSNNIYHPENGNKFIINDFNDDLSSEINEKEFIIFSPSNNLSKEKSKFKIIDFISNINLYKKYKKNTVFEIIKELKCGYFIIFGTNSLIIYDSLFNKKLSITAKVLINNIYEIIDNDSTDQFTKIIICSKTGLYF